jgi:poly(3-hydroxybutyrate) depolymerase
MPRVRAASLSRVVVALLASAMLLPLAALLSACSQPTVARKLPDAFETSGRTTNLLIHAPPAAAVKPYPLVIALHSLHYDSANAEKVFGLDALADREGFVVAYPNGVQGSWNAGSCCAYAASQRLDDVAYLRAVISHLEQRYPIDRRRVVLIGLSNGGMLAYRYACEHADEIAGIGVVAGSVQVPACRPSAPVTVVSVHGLKDRLVPYNGQSWSPVLQTSITSTKDGLESFRDVDRCSPPNPASDATLTDSAGLPESVAPPETDDPGATVSIKVETPCLSPARVVEFDLPDLGHGWPALTGANHFGTASALWRVLADAQSERIGPDL